MEDNKEIKKQIFSNDAKTITNMMFDNKLFKDHLTRDDFNSFEEFICFLLESRFESYIKLKSITDKIENRTK